MKPKLPNGLMNFTGQDWHETEPLDALQERAARFAALTGPSGYSTCAQLRDLLVQIEGEAVIVVQK